MTLIIDRATYGTPPTDVGTGNWTIIPFTDGATDLYSHNDIGDTRANSIVSDNNIPTDQAEYILAFFRHIVQDGTSGMFIADYNQLPFYRVNPTDSGNAASHPVATRTGDIEDIVQLRRGPIGPNGEAPFTIYISTTSESYFAGSQRDSGLISGPTEVLQMRTQARADAADDFDVSLDRVPVDVRVTTVPGSGVPTFTFVYNSFDNRTVTIDSDTTISIGPTGSRRVWRVGDYTVPSDSNITLTPTDSEFSLVPTGAGAAPLQFRMYDTMLLDDLFDLRGLISDRAINARSLEDVIVLDANPNDIVVAPQMSGTRPSNGVYAGSSSKEDLRRPRRPVFSRAPNTTVRLPTAKSTPPRKYDVIRGSRPR